MYNMNIHIWYSANYSSTLYDVIDHSLFEDSSIPDSSITDSEKFLQI